MNATLWFTQDRIEAESPLGIYTRHGAEKARKVSPRLPATHSVFGPCEIDVSEDRHYDTLGAIVRLEFPNSELNGAYSTRFVEKAEPRVQAEERSAA